MADIREIRARRHHCGQMSRLLRLEHHEAALRVGRDTHRGLRDVFDSSYLRKAWTVDGDLAALAGVMGTFLSPSGYLWLALSQKATRFPLAIVRGGKRLIEEAMTTKVQLETTVIGGDEAALRLAIYLGFHVADSGPGAAAFSHHGRRMLMRHIKTEPDLRIPFGDGFAIRMGYHADYFGEAHG